MRDSTRLLGASLFLAAAAACGGSSEPGAGVDAPGVSDAATGDAAPSADAGDATDAAGTMPTGCATGTHVIYLNHAGGAYHPGSNNSSTNSSTIVQTAGTLAGWSGSPAMIGALEQCVAHDFARYDVRVVNQDPGAAEHLEVVLSNDLTPIGLPASAPGAAPQTCAPISRAIIFYAPNHYSDQARLCQDISQSLGVALGLDLLWDADSIMTYQASPPTRSFRDAVLPCGTQGTGPCLCGGTSENSHQKLVAALGLCPP